MQVSNTPVFIQRKKSFFLGTLFGDASLHLSVVCKDAVGPCCIHQKDQIIVVISLILEIVFFELLATSIKRPIASLTFLEGPLFSNAAIESSGAVAVVINVKLVVAGENFLLFTDSDHMRIVFQRSGLVSESEPTLFL